MFCAQKAFKSASHKTNIEPDYMIIVVICSINRTQQKCCCVNVILVCETTTFYDERKHVP